MQPTQKAARLISSVKHGGMSMDPTTISLVALGVALVSLILSAHRGAVDRRLQLEQLRGEMRVRLTSRGVDLLSMIDALRQDNPPEGDSLIGKLVKVARGLVDVREDLRDLRMPFFVPASLFATNFQRIRDDIEDAEPVFKRLRRAIDERNFAEASQIADGLLERVYGRDEKAA